MIYFDCICIWRRFRADRILRSVIGVRPLKVVLAFKSAIRVTVSHTNIYKLPLIAKVEKNKEACPYPYQLTFFESYLTIFEPPLEMRVPFEAMMSTVSPPCLMVSLFPSLEYT